MVESTDVEGLSRPDDDCARLEDLQAESGVRDVLSLFGKKYTLAIMYEFAFSEGGLRFKDLEARLDISSTTLSNRLAELTEAEYVERHSYDEVPPRVEYVATEKTHALTSIFEDLYDWANAYAPES
ncbi:winged helix-turn-helix transcriptional regulator [Halobaculum magnesiiphilum]|uniref:Helix-turn-helix transcriptional regulator n=1 Tax=Halobaculum magnesiiphilum TaxID=1017351 RepID=A0A8T8WFB0_9EURY|nr:helix-turn-helix domain-containing protein [Halobaculum magnesiiphilum]QZP38423.1 helix-turn-helix transcriptional regulator [Halobaculum magnesiiphilum]